MCRPEVQNVAVQVRALWSRACFGMCRPGCATGDSSGDPEGIED